MFQNPEGWGCDSHESKQLFWYQEMATRLKFQNPEGWGCDSHRYLRLTCGIMP